VADKLTQSILDGLTRAASESSGMPLIASRSEPGLFPATTLGRSSAQKCQVDSLIAVARTETRGKSTCDYFTLTDAGWDFLLSRVNPKQVLEDFVRVLESRQGEVHGLLELARRMANSLEGLKDAVGRILPQITTGTMRPPQVDREPEPRRIASLMAEEEVEEDAFTNVRAAASLNGRHDSTNVAVLEAPAVELTGAMLARLADWASTAGASEDCPLPDLFRSLGTREPAPSVGEFHDCLRTLHSRGKVYLHPWTGPLYALPEPTYALMVGHNVAYYASIR